MPSCFITAKQRADIDVLCIERQQQQQQQQDMKQWHRTAEAAARARGGLPKLRLLAAPWLPYEVYFTT
jgi:hypothetical protein